MSDIETAALTLGLPSQAVRILMEQNEINIGYVVRRPGRRNTYYVVPELLRREAENIGKQKPISDADAE